MSMEVGINGMGRIGRLLLRACVEKGIKIAAVNTSSDIHSLIHLLKYDSNHGKFKADVQIKENSIIINNNDNSHQEIKVINQRNIEKLNWEELNVNTVFECSGRLLSKELASAHIKAGAKKVIISAPCDDADKTIIMGVNEQELNPIHKIISIGSCTTNALGPLVKIFNDGLGIEQGYVTTIHAYTFDQNLLDNFHNDLRRARSASMSMIPTKSGVSKALKLIIPEIGEKISGSAIRVPTANVSLIDFSFTSKVKTTINQVNSLLKQSVENNKISSIVGIVDEPLVSIDFSHDPRSTIFDCLETKVVDNKLVRVLSWYDNEWGFVNRMIDVYTRHKWKGV